MITLSYAHEGEIESAINESLVMSFIGSTEIEDEDSKVVKNFFSFDAKTNIEDLDIHVHGTATYEVENYDGEVYKSTEVENYICYTIGGVEINIDARVDMESIVTDHIKSYFEKKAA